VGISALYYLKNYAVLLALCALLCTERAAAIWQKLMARKWLRVLLLAALLLISLAYITDATYSPFLYTQF
ncbi:MAG: MBOAT family protein, partial [Oscillospiraceae bacterium]|nr:MBOAT family protein [Oscillospiraceae bacterium]